MFPFFVTNASVKSFDARPDKYSALRFSTRVEESTIKGATPCSANERNCPCVSMCPKIEIFPSPSSTRTSFSCVPAKCPSILVASLNVSLIAKPNLSILPKVIPPPSKKSKTIAMMATQKSRHGRRQYLSATQLKRYQRWERDC